MVGAGRDLPLQISCRMYKKYQKDSNYSYTLGYATTLDLLRYQPQHVLRVAAKPENEDNQTFQEIKRLCAQHRIEFIVNANQIDRLSLKENCYVVGFFKKYPMQLQPNTNHVMLVNPSDMGNMGTIIRTMLGFNHTNLAVIKPGCDVWAPKVVRGSMGALFQVNVEYFNSLDEYHAQHAHNKFYPFILEGKTELKNLNPPQPYTLIFGNEGAGLPDEYSSMGKSVVIKHSKNIDSLNLGISVSLALYQVSN